MKKILVSLAAILIGLSMTGFNSVLADESFVEGIGEKTEDVAQKAVEATKSGADKAGKAIKKGAVKTKDATVKGAKKAGEATVRGAKRASKATAKGINKSASKLKDATGRYVEKTTKELEEAAPAKKCECGCNCKCNCGCETSKCNTEE